MKIEKDKMNAIRAELELMQERVFGCVSLDRQRASEYRQLGFVELARFCADNARAGEKLAMKIARDLRKLEVTP